MATVSTLGASLTGTTVTAAAASAGGDRFAPGTRVHVVNGAAAPIDAILTTPGTVRGLPIGDRTISIPNGTFPANTKFFDVPADLYQDPVDGLVGVAWSASASVTFWVEGPVIS